MKRNEYIIESPKVTADMNIAICSDFHINNRTPNEKIDDALQTLDDIKPTQIVIPGDLYDTECEYYIKGGKIAKFIDNAVDIAEVFYVKGNIEPDSGLLPYELYNNHNSRFRVLCERIIPSVTHSFIESNGMNIAAIKPDLDFYKLNESTRAMKLYFHYRKYLERISYFCGSKEFYVLLYHDPIIAESMHCYH